MKLFSFWTREEIVQAIRDLEEQLATGAAQVSYTGGGSVQYSSRDNAVKTLKSLYSRIREIDGGKQKSPVRHVRVISKKGY